MNSDEGPTTARALWPGGGRALRILLGQMRRHRIGRHRLTASLRKRWIDKVSGARALGVRMTPEGLEAIASELVDELRHPAG